MKPIPDDPRILHILDVFWREIKSINWHEFQTYAIIGLSAIMLYHCLSYIYSEYGKNEVNSFIGFTFIFFHSV